MLRPAVVLAILLALAAPARADDDVRPGQAERLIEDGRTLFVRDADYAGALDRFRRAYALSPSWQALAGEGAVHQKRGSYVEALECYERLVREFATALSEAQVARAREQIASLRTRVAVVVVIARQPGVRVLIDGRDIGVAPLRTEMRLLPGPHTLMASGEPYDALARSFDVSAGDTVPLVVALPPAMMLVERTRLARRWPAWKPWLGIAAGAAVGVTGVLLRQSAADDVAAIDDQVRNAGGSVPVEGDAAGLESADRKYALAIALIAGGGVALITGAVAAIYNQPRPVVDQRRVPRLRVSPGGVALTVPF